MKHLFLAVILMVSAVAARAQTMAVAVDDPSSEFTPALASHEIRVIARILNLGDPERDALLALYEGHSAAMRDRATEISEQREERLEEAQALGDLSMASVGEEQRNAWKAEGEKARAAFFEDLKALLSKEQVDRWPMVERELRRFKSLGRGKISGESLDLIRLVDEHAPGSWSNAELAGALAVYAQQLDTALVRRDAFLDGPEAQDFGRLCEKDKAAAMALWQSATALRVAVRDLNLKTAEEVAALMPEPQAGVFRARVFEAAYPRLARPSRTESYIRAAAKLSSLTAEQRVGVASVMESFEARLASVRKEQAALAREEDATKPPLPLRGPGGGATTATTADGNLITFYSPSMEIDKESPAYKVQARRFQLEIETKRRLNALLTTEQRAECKQPAMTQMTFGEGETWGL